MAKSYYSTIFEHPADDVWNVIRDFNNIGAVRNVLYDRNVFRRWLESLRRQLGGAGTV